MINVNSSLIKQVHGFYRAQMFLQIQAWTHESVSSTEGFRTNFPSDEHGWRSSSLTAGCKTNGPSGIMQISFTPSQDIYSKTRFVGETKWVFTYLSVRQWTVCESFWKLLGSGPYKRSLRVSLSLTFRYLELVTQQDVGSSWFPTKKEVVGNILVSWTCFVTYFKWMNPVSLK